MPPSNDPQPSMIPPPPCETMTLREWLTGCVLSNSSLIKDGTPSEAGSRAVAIADEAILALRQNPTPREIAAPNESNILAWERQILENSIPTIPAVRVVAGSVNE